MFPGGGAQYASMARDLYETEPVFAEWMDRGLKHLEPQLDYDIRAIWLPEPEDRAQAEITLKKPSVQLPLIMIVEYALAQLWLSWGVKPAALVGKVFSLSAPRHCRLAAGSGRFSELAGGQGAGASGNGVRDSTFSGVPVPGSRVHEIACRKACPGSGSGAIVGWMAIDAGGVR